MKKCIIFTGGDYDNIDFVLSYKFDNSYVVCADSGYRLARDCGIKPDYCIGDFDSLGFVPKECGEIDEYNCEKDDTDTNLAIKHCLSKGFKDFIIFGGLGNRIDHTFANLQSLSYIIDNGAKGKFVGEHDVVTMIKNDETIIENIYGYSLSVFSFTEKSQGVSIDGTKYTLDNSVLTQSFPIGISNEIIENFAKISVDDGKLVIIQSKL